MRRLVWIALVVAGCNGPGLSGKDIELSVDVRADVFNSDVDSVRTLELAAIGADSGTMIYTLTRPLLRHEQIIVRFPSARGHVIVTALARDGGSQVVMRGASDDVDLEAGAGVHPAMVTMAPPPAGPHVASGFEVAPKSFTLFTGQSLQLASESERVSWSASDGGTIDDSGLYTAPSTAGTYHAVATSATYPTDRALVTLNVLANGIALYAGTLGGAGSVDGNGAAARVNQPHSLVYRGSAIYFADNGDELRRLDPMTGDVSTLAGRPDYSLAVDGSTAVGAFAGPNGLAFDGSFTFYVADGGCPCIRAVDHDSGQVTTIAGAAGMYGTSDGTGAAAQFRLPIALAFDAAKKLLYVGEELAHTIRTVDVASGKVTTIAGVADMAGFADGPAATAKLENPTQLVLDGNALYFYDQRNAKLRKLDLGTMMVSTVASMQQTVAMASAGPGKLVLSQPLRIFDTGTGMTTQFLGTDKQPFYDYYNSILPAGDGTNFYAGSIADIQHIDVSTGVKTSIAGFQLPWQETLGPRATARIDSLNSIAVRSDGTIWARDNRILRIDPPGTIAAVSVNANQVVNWDGGMTFGSDGALYACDGNLNTIVRIDVDHGGTVTQWAGAPGVAGYADGTVADARFAQPHDITSDGGKLYVSDGNNDVIRVIDLASGMVSTLAGGPGMCGFVDMPGAQARFCAPQGIVADGAGNLYVADNNAVRKIVISGAAVSQLVANNGLGFVDGPSGTAKLWGPFRMTFDAAKKFLYFSDLGNDAVRRVEVATGIVSTVAGGPLKPMAVEGALPGSINQPGGLAFAATGELLVAVPRESSILQIRLP